MKRRKREASVRFRSFADSLGGHQQDLARYQRANGFEIGAIRHHGGQDKRASRGQYRHRRLAAIVARKDLDLTIDHQVQEIGWIAFANEFDEWREALQER